jgi:flagellar assembly factor FliW
MTVESDLLGKLTVDADAVIRFPEGMLGFPECRSFVLLPAEREHVYWLQSVDYSTLAFVMIDPFVFFEGYGVELADTGLDSKDVSPSEVSVLAIVTLPQDRTSRPTANLQGPLVINHKARTAHQAVLADGRYGIREEFDL